MRVVGVDMDMDMAVGIMVVLLVGLRGGGGGWRRGGRRSIISMVMVMVIKMRNMGRMETLRTDSTMFGAGEMRRGSVTYLLPGIP